MVVYSEIDSISKASYSALEDIAGDGMFSVHKYNGRLVDADDIAAAEEADLVIFLSRHKSSSGNLSFTTHPLGNWGENADVGGRPRSLSPAAPIEMLALLQCMERNNDIGFDVTYEATHHGPLIDRPVLFAEFGGPEPDTMELEKPAEILARSVYESLSDSRPEFDKVALGIGCPHYPSRFTRLALAGKYAFSHIMPNYAVANVEMIPVALKRSTPEPEVAVIEWKGIKSADRESVIKCLEDSGLDYVRV